VYQIEFHPEAQDPRKTFILEKRFQEQADREPKEKTPNTPSKTKPFLFLLLSNISHESIALLLDPVLSPLTGSLGLGTLGVHLLLQDTLTSLLSLGLVDVLNKGALVLEGVTLAGVVQLMVEVLVDLARRTVLDEQAAEDTHAAHPQNLRGHTGIGGTLALTITGVTASATSILEITGSAARVHGIRLLDDKSVRDQLADGLARVGVGDLVHLIGVQPDLSLSAVHDGRSKTLLGSEVNHFE